MMVSSQVTSAIDGSTNVHQIVNKVVKWHIVRQSIMRDKTDKQLPWIQRQGYSNFIHGRYAKRQKPAADCTRYE